MKKSFPLFAALFIFIFAAAAYAEENQGAARPAETSDCAGASVPGEAQCARQEGAAEIGIEMASGVVTKIHDAGTIEIDGKTMRLLGVSAPRRWWWGQSRDCYSLISTKYVEDSILGREVSFTKDPNFGNIKDGHHRIYLYIDGRQINSELIQKGLVLADRTKEYLEKERYAALEDDARFHFTGLWHTCAVECEHRGTCRTKNW